MSINADGESKSDESDEGDDVDNENKENDSFSVSDSIASSLKSLRLKKRRNTITMLTSFMGKEKKRSEAKNKCKPSKTKEKIMVS